MNRKKSLRKIFFFYLILTLAISAVFVPKKRSEAAVIPAKDHSALIWFGDSRTVYLGLAVYGYSGSRHPRQLVRKHVVARRSTTLGWAKGSGYRFLSKRLKKNPSATVIFNFGVNDIGRGQNHASGYLDLIKKIKKNYPKARICFMTVNPVKGNSRNPYARTKARAAVINRRIDSFNSYMRKHLPAGCLYIDTRNHVRFSYRDGLHYTKSTYKKICKYVTGKRKLKK